MLLTFIPTEAAVTTGLSVSGLVAVAFGAAMTNLAPDHKAGWGARHRKPGLPKVGRVGGRGAHQVGVPTAGRLSDEEYARALGMAGGFR